MNDQLCRRCSKINTFFSQHHTHCAKSWVNERYHDVPGALGDPQTLMVVSQSSWMHQHPTGFGVGHGAVVTYESTTATLVVLTGTI